MKIKLLLLVLLSLLLTTGGACMKSVSSLTPVPTPVPDTQPSASSTLQPEGTTAKSLKIGVVLYEGGGVQLDMLRSVQLMAETDNQNGGLDIGGEKYKVEILPYDTNGIQATEVAAVNRLIFEDKVKYIMSDGLGIGSWLAVSEANKVLVGSLVPVPQLTLMPNLQYSFHPFSQNSLGSVVIGWFCKNYPDLAKNYVLALPDNQGGRMVSGMIEAGWKAFGVTPMMEFYPASATDLSSLGTKIKTLNPGAFGAAAGGASDGLAIKAVWQAGYRGQIFVNTGVTALSLSQTVPPEALDGLINAAWATEFDTPPTQAAQEFKDAWIAKYGKWESPEVVGTCYYACMKTALKQAKSVDTDKVAEVIFNGLKYEGPTGFFQMVSRPDIGNDRTVDSITAAYVKQIKGGKPTLLATIGIDEGMTYFQQMLTSAPPMPAGPPPDSAPGGTPSGSP